MHVFKSGVWVYDDGKPGVDPIYLNMSILKLDDNRLDRTIESMAHEIYHRTEPYGKADSSLYEEFSAYFISTHISGATWTNIEAYDPRKPACLTRWFNDRNLMYGYEGIDPYPASVIANVDYSEQNCVLADEVANPIASVSASQEKPATQVDTNYILDCRANSVGLIECQKIEEGKTTLK